MTFSHRAQERTTHDGAVTTETAEAGLVYTLPSVLAGEPVTVVVHDHDGDWQFLTHEDFTVDDGVLVHLEHILAAAPELRTVMKELPGGRAASRSSPGEHWHYWDVDDLDDA